MIKYLIFDLDNTLYSSRYGLELNVEERLKNFCSDFLGIPPEEAWQQRREAKQYGTCLEWLMTEKGFTDIEAYMSAAHPKGEADTLPHDTDLRIFLSDIRLPKAILTNSPREHADLILDKLRIANLFTHIFDIRASNFIGKPRREVYENALVTLEVEAKDVLFIDDIPACVEAFAGMGGKALLFDENNVHEKCSVRKIRKLTEIRKFIGLRA